MKYDGQAAIDYLAREVGGADAAESSHWRMYHSTFRFLGDRFEGLQGFGGSEKRPVALRWALHRFLQRRFRSIGRDLPRFAAIDAQANEITRTQGRAYDLDVLRQALTLAFLGKHIAHPTQAVCVIGDGFASMTALLLATRAAARVILVNLTKTLLVDLWYLRLWMGSARFESTVCLVTDRDGLSAALTRPPGSTGCVVAIEAGRHELLRGCSFELVLNIVSMQEMDPPVIATYFADLRAVADSRKVLFYCCNREEKMLPDGTVTRFDAYPWDVADRVHVDELCPWHQQHYAFRPPFYRPYDGPIRHRLVTLVPASRRTSSNASGAINESYISE